MKRSGSLSNENWLEELKPEELPEPYASIVIKLGIEHTLLLANLYQGTGVYFPKIDKLLAKIRDKKIKREFNGGNYKQLAIKYKLTEQWIREIVDNDHMVDQVSMF